MKRKIKNLNGISNVKGLGDLAQRTQVGVVPHLLIESK